jgi:tRNA1Val (adenine37-N6)-methyltransferase
MAINHFSDDSGNALETTEDSFFGGRMKVLQPLDGYRFSIDAVLLAAFSAPNALNTIVDLGTGCGIIPLILGYRLPESRIIGIEIQTELACLARKNIEINGLKDRISVIDGDMKSIGINDVSGPVDLVLCNPPYRKYRSGRINPHQQRAIARHEISATLSDVTNIASRLLGIGGRFAVIYPAERITDLLTAMRAAGIEPKCLQTVHSRIHDPARLLLVSGIKGAKPGSIIQEPLTIYQPDGKYTDPVQDMFEP